MIREVSTLELWLNVCRHTVWQRPNAVVLFVLGGTNITVRLRPMDLQFRLEKGFCREGFGETTILLDPLYRIGKTAISGWDATSQNELLLQRSNAGIRHGCGRNMDSAVDKALVLNQEDGLFSSIIYSGQYGDSAKIKPSICPKRSVRFGCIWYRMASLLELTKFRLECIVPH